MQIFENRKNTDGKKTWKMRKKELVIRYWVLDLIIFGLGQVAQDWCNIDEYQILKIFNDFVDSWSRCQDGWSGWRGAVWILCSDGDARVGESSPYAVCEGSTGWSSLSSFSQRLVESHLWHVQATGQICDFVWIFFPYCCVYLFCQILCDQLQIQAI